MASSVSSFPHPVLGWVDDVQSSVQVSPPRISYVGGIIEIVFQVELDDPDFSRLLRLGVARLAVRWSCSATMSKGTLEPKLEWLGPNRFRFSGLLTQESVEGEVSFSIEATATRRIENFSWTNQNPDYGDAKFDILRGDFLALLGEFKLRVRTFYDPMDPPLGTCIRIVPNPKLTNQIEARYNESDAVVIHVPEEFAAGLISLNGQPGHQLALVVLPALVETLTELRIDLQREDGGEHSGKLWAETISRMVEDSNSSLDQPLIAAQRILEFPLWATFEGLQEQEDEEE